MAFVQFMKGVQPLDGVDDAVGCDCLRRAAAEGGENESDVDRLQEASNCTAAGE